MNWCGPNIAAEAHKIATDTCTTCGHVRHKNEPSLWSNSYLLGVTDQSALCSECFDGWYEHGIVDREELAARSKAVHAYRLSVDVALGLRNLPAITYARYIIVGTLNHERSEAVFKIASQKGKWFAVSMQDLDFIIVGADPGSKLTVARSLGIREVDSDQFDQMIEVIEELRHGAP